MKITVVGCGNGAFATAIDLSAQGHEITLYADESHAGNFDTIMDSRTITGEGKGPQGPVELHCVTCSEEVAYRDPDLIIVSVPANAQEDIAGRMAPYIHDGERIVLSPGGTGGALVFARILSERSEAKDLRIGEFHTLPYTARKTGPGSVNIILMVRFLMFAAYPAKYNEEMFGIVSSLYPYTVMAHDVLETSLNNGNMSTHPAPVVLNAGKIEYYGRHYHYKEGITPSVAKVIQLIDDERKAVCRAFGYEEIDVKDRLYWMGYTPKGETVYDCISSSHDVFLPVEGPNRLSDRYLTEDTPVGLVFLTDLARALGVETPVSDAVIRLASALMSEDYYATGRTLERAGLGGMTTDEIRRYLETGDRP